MERHLEVCLIGDNLSEKKWKIKLFTVCTDESDGLENWKLSANLMGYDWKVIGLGEKWGGWKWRTKKYIEEISKVEEECLIILTDGTDVIFTRHQNNMIQAFREYDSNVVIGAEHQCCTSWPRWNFSVKQKILEFARRKNPEVRPIVPNGGFVMGFKSDVLQTLCSNIEQEDDQHGYLVQYLTVQSNFKLDIYSRCVANIVYDISLFDSKDDERQESEIYKFDGKKFVSKETQNSPCAMHFPGGNIEAYNFFGEFLFKDAFKKVTKNRRTFTDTIKKSWALEIKRKLI